VGVVWSSCAVPCPDEDPDDEDDDDDLLACPIIA